MIAFILVVAVACAIAIAYASGIMHGRRLEARRLADRERADGTVLTDRHAIMPPPPIYPIDDDNDDDLKEARARCFQDAMAKALRYHRGSLA